MNAAELMTDPIPEHTRVALGSFRPAGIRAGPSPDPERSAV